MNALKLISASSIILGVSFILRFALTFLLARFLQPDQLGIYSWSVTAFGISTIIVNFGLDFFLIRKIPEFRELNETMVANIVNFAKKQVIINTFFVILIVIPLSYLSIFLFDEGVKYYLELMLIIFALPFAGLTLVFSTTLRSFDFPLIGQFVESNLQTGIFFILVLLSFSTITADHRVTFLLVGLFVCSWVFSYFISRILYNNRISLQSNIEAKKETITDWRKKSFIIMHGVLGWSLLGRSDVLLLAFLVPPSEVGAYFICLRLGEILLFFSSVSYYIWSAEISKLIQTNCLEQAQNLLRKSSKLCFLTTFTLACLGLTFAEDILFFVNESYINYVFVLKIALCVFFLMGAAGMINPIYYILGQQAFLAKTQWIIGLIFLALIFLTVPIYGIEGCAIVFCICRGAYILILGIRLKIKHKLSILPI